MSEKRYLTAREAAAALGITRATLYAYVSRGLIRSESAEEGSRRHRYHAADVRRLQQRQRQRRNPAAAAEQALQWGAPVLESAITLLDDGKLYYRGRDVLALAAEESVEAVASLLWTGRLDDDLFAGQGAPLPPGWEKVAPSINHLSTVEKFAIALSLAAAADFAAYDLRRDAVVATGAGILLLLARVAAGVSPAGQGIAPALAQGWSLAAQATPLFSAALILCADHELNVSSFTARCIASAGATPYGAVQGGLAALQGTRHGGHTARVEALFREIGAPRAARSVLADRLRRGERLPGFGHPLYPGGDPRARQLLHLAAGYLADAPAVELARATAAAATDLLGEEPTIDFALVTVARALALPPGSALTLFALGRAAGWIGHALEQYKAGTLIRPRARYSGPIPG